MLTDLCVNLIPDLTPYDINLSSQNEAIFSTGVHGLQPETNTFLSCSFCALFIKVLHHDYLQPLNAPAMLSSLFDMAFCRFDAS